MKQIGILPEGMYSVGNDLPAGNYKIITTGSFDGYFEICSNSSHSFGSIITNDFFSGEKNLTVYDGQYLMLSNAELQLR
ncbi:MAG: hypothetical protein FWD43_02090 [Coriobacteriia bacterium]|nr:hypothetical protein [Coriobacteriia bacterium]